MEDLDRYLSLAREKDIDHAVVLSTAEIYTAPWVTIKCQYGCFHYGESLCCPPRTPDHEKMRAILNSYSRAILLHKLWKEETRDIRSFNEAVVDIELALFFDGYYKAWSMGSGPCRHCEKCNLEGRCVHGDRARPSMEACAIDVFRTASEKGLSFPVLRDVKEQRNSFGLVLVK